MTDLWVPILATSLFLSLGVGTSKPNQYLVILSAAKDLRFSNA